MHICYTLAAIAVCDDFRYKIVIFVFYESKATQHILFGLN